MAILRPSACTGLRLSFGLAASSARHFDKRAIGRKLQPEQLHWGAIAVGKRCSSKCAGRNERSTDDLQIGKSAAI